jgi:hypothetical protein
MKDVSCINDYTITISFCPFLQFPLSPSR